MKNKLYLILLICLVSACNKLETYNNIPIITEGSYQLYKNAIGQDTSISLQFTFTDGDGNVGLSASDTFPPNDKNVFIDYYEKQNGQFTKILIPSTQDTLNFNSRIRRYGSGNPSKADVKININIAAVIADTIRFDYYIVDRDFNKSNLMTTGPIPVNRF